MLESPLVSAICMWGFGGRCFALGWTWCLGVLRVLMVQAAHGRIRGQVWGYNTGGEEQQGVVNIGRAEAEVSLRKALKEHRSHS